MSFFVMLAAVIIPVLVGGAFIDGMIDRKIKKDREKQQLEYRRYTY